MNHWLKLLVGDAKPSYYIFKCGHPMTTENMRKNGKWWRCKKCHQEANKDWHVKNKEAA